MPDPVAIIGIGQTQFRATTPGVSYKELMFEAASRAYADAGIDARRDIDSFVACSEDFNEGTGIFDEYVPDQLGAVLRPVHTIAGDGIHGLIAAYMQVLTGVFDVVAVEAHSKASNVLTPHHVLSLALDPGLVRPLGAHPHFVAGLEMDRYLAESGTSREQCAAVVAKNRFNALFNDCAAYGADVEVEDVLRSAPTFAPLTALDTSAPADGGTVVVLASEARARALGADAVWIHGAGWCSDSHGLDSRSWGTAEYARLAAKRAYELAGIATPSREIDFAEVDDTFSYKELQHLEALGLFGEGEAGPATEEGLTAIDGDLPVNASGGSLGVGHLGEATGLQKVVEVVRQLRGEAGQRQIEDAEVGLAQSWRGVPVATGAVVVLGRE